MNKEFVVHRRLNSLRRSHFRLVGIFPREFVTELISSFLEAGGIRRNFVSGVARFGKMTNSLLKRYFVGNEKTEILF